MRQRNRDSEEAQRCARRVLTSVLWRTQSTGDRKQTSDADRPHGSRNPHIELRAFCAIIYQLATDGLAATARTASIYKDEKFSDHAPLTISYDFTL